MKGSDVHVNKVTNVFRSTVSLIDNISVLSSKYPLSESLSIGTSDLKNNPPHKMKLKQLVKEVTSILDDNDIETNIDCLGSH